MIKAYIASSSRGNPRRAGVGILIDLPEKFKPRQIATPVGEKTNNEAEYDALLRCLRVLEPYKNTEDIIIYSSSKLVVCQVNGQWQVKDKNLFPLFQEVKNLTTVRHLVLRCYRPESPAVWTESILAILSPPFLGKKLLRRSLVGELPKELVKSDQTIFVIWLKYFCNHTSTPRLITQFLIRKHFTPFFGSKSMSAHTVRKSVRFIKFFAFSIAFHNMFSFPLTI